MRCWQSDKLLNAFVIFPKRCNITQFIYFWKTALYVSDGISTHHQEHTQLYLKYLVLVKPLLLPASIVEELELVWMWCGFWSVLVRLQPHQNRSIQYPHHTQTSSTSSTIEAGSSNGLTSTRYCKYSCVCSWWWVEIPPETCRAVFQK